MTTGTTESGGRLERVIGIVLYAGVTTSTVCLAAGVVLSFFHGQALTETLLNVGIVVLLATPIARVFVSIVEYAIERDWTFAALTAIVLLELMASVVAALFFNRKV